MNKWLVTLICLLSLLALVFSIATCGGDDDDDDNNDDNDDNDTGDDDDDDDDDGGVEVPADDANGVDSGVDVEAGGVLVITTTGSVVLEEGGEPVGPDGVADTPCGEGSPIPTANCGALLGHIKGMTEGFVIGSNYSQTMTGTGDLMFLVNDTDYLNNSGAFSVTVGYTSPEGDDDDDNPWEN